MPTSLLDRATFLLPSQGSLNWLMCKGPHLAPQFVLGLKTSAGALSLPVCWLLTRRPVSASWAPSVIPSQHSHCVSSAWLRAMCHFYQFINGRLCVWPQASVCPAERPDKLTLGTALPWCVTQPATLFTLNESVPPLAHSLIISSNHSLPRTQPWRHLMRVTRLLFALSV